MHLLVEFKLLNMKNYSLLASKIILILLFTSCQKDKKRISMLTNDNIKIWNVFDTLDYRNTFYVLYKNGDCYYGLGGKTATKAGSVILKKVTK